VRSFSFLLVVVSVVVVVVALDSRLFVLGSRLAVVFLDGPGVSKAATPLLSNNEAHTTRELTASRNRRVIREGRSAMTVERARGRIGARHTAHETVGQT
jgi:hypothetical protein